MAYKEPEKSSVPRAKQRDAIGAFLLAEATKALNLQKYKKSSKW